MALQLYTLLHLQTLSSQIYHKVLFNILGLIIKQSRCFLLQTGNIISRTFLSNRCTLGVSRKFHRNYTNIATVNFSVQY